MDLDIEHYLGAVHRSVTSLERGGEPARAVAMARTYDTDREDLWDALTSKERLPRWFLPIEGDLELGGRYQLRGNASGTITECDPPKSFALTWEFGGGVSWVEVTLDPDDSGRTRLNLVHTAPVTPHWAEYGPGATGIGWELGLLGLALHIAEPGSKLEEDTFSTSPEGSAYMTGSGRAWAEADIAAGEDPDQAHAAADRTIAFYTGVEVPQA